jgi:lysylphosphatidylglycerol synthetase-like protein (DUF2156 family)
MSNMWLKTKIWAKGIVVGLVAIYALLFIYNNSGNPVPVWLWFGTSPTLSPLLMLLVAFAIGVVATVLVRTVLRTIRQIKELRERSRIERLERENADMKNKAAMLHTRPDEGAAETPGATEL